MARPEPTVYGILWWLFARWGNVESFDHLSRLAIPSTLDAVRANTEQFVRDFANNPEMFVPGGQARFREGVDLDVLAEQLTASHFINARAYQDAAVLIFAHSILTEAVNATWDIAEEVDQDAVRQAERREPDSRDSKMPRRVAVIRTICSAVEHRCESGITGFRYERSRLERLDRLRGELVHGHRLGDPIELSQDDVRFLKHVGMYVWLMLFWAFVDTLKPSQVGTMPGMPPPAATT
jgi:hypothetical protein